MKALVYLSVIATIFLTACTTSRTGSVATDDIYYVPGDQPVVVERTITTTPSNDYRSNDYSNYSDSYRDDNGNTYITNNYYDYNDYHYTSRLRRFYNPYVGFNYYSGIYTDYYWYTHNPVNYGITISIGYGRPYYHPYHTYYGYMPYYSYGYNPYGWHNHHYHGYSSYWSGYNHGYHNGYYNGYYGSPYGNYYGNDYYYGGNKNTNTYYGPRNTISTNTAGGTRGSVVSYGKTETGTSMPGNVSADRDAVNRTGEKTNSTRTAGNVSTPGSVTDSRTGEREDVRTGVTDRGQGRSVTEGRAGTTAVSDRDIRTGNEGRLSTSSDRNIIEDRPRTYQAERQNSIYAPDNDRQRSTSGTVVERNSDNNRTNRSAYERERYIPSTERTPSNYEQRSTDNNVYQPRINTDSRNNRYQPQNDRIYVPRQREATPQRQATPQRETSPRRIQRRSEPAPQRQSNPAPAPSYERRGSDNNSGGSAAPASRSGSKSSENSSSGRRGR